MSAEKLIRFMKEADMDIRELCSISGFNEKYIARVLKGKIRPKEKTAERLASSLGINTGELLPGSGHRNEEYDKDFYMEYRSMDILDRQ
ncbi:MAG: helix-turn-helix transcriptional regulator, partial [Lachnospiraceae bacterium]|nr:helix-turn-helix transcriptional regulator [Lachnospiraceae bacterium]